LDHIEYCQTYLEARNDYLRLKNILQVGGGIRLQSPDISNDQEIDTIYTRYGKNKQPEFKWDNIPPKTVELVLVCSDPDAIRVGGDTWVHWVVHSISPVDKKLVPGRYVEATNSFKRIGYDGPEPPVNSGIHHYFFTLYALDKKSDFGTGRYTYADLQSDQRQDYREG
jgi:Raf kinase inhibitor-like YbhB/YbcL family protein